ncbi:hypothetical protein DERP_002951, partial [Dermatophagoides pteronyssinus]
PLHEIIFSDSKNSQMANEKQKLRLKTKMLDSNYFNCLIELLTMFRMLANCFKFQILVNSIGTHRRQMEEDPIQMKEDPIQMKEDPIQYLLL